MSEIVFPPSGYPAQSLFLIEEMVGDKLDDYIYELKAVSATESIKPKEEMPYKWALAKTYQNPLLFINYSFKKFPEHQDVETFIKKFSNTLENLTWFYITDKILGKRTKRKSGKACGMRPLR